MVNQILERGGESIIYKVGNEIVKERIKKGYRHEVLDITLRKKRTKNEAAILKKLRSVVNVPEVKEVTEYSIKMEYVEGITLKDWIEQKWCEEEGREIINRVAEMLSRIHNQNISHQDFTPKNIILKGGEGKGKREIYVIDFGLAIYTTRAEDRAIDLYLFEEVVKALNIEEALKERIIDIFLHSYFTSLPSTSQRDLIKRRLEIIRKRRRYTKKGETNEG